uniref:myb-related transcription factor, partner of profilin-like n=1 Tax=Pristiophorus japonicus TaxID=55135 RepID=UPI00398E86E4
MEMLKKKSKCRNIKKDGRLWAPAIDETELPVLLENITERYSDLTKGGPGKPSPKEYNRIWDEIGEAVSSTSTMVHTGERCRRRWNDPTRVARKTSAIAANQQPTGGGPQMQEPVTEIEIRALSLVGDSNCATIGIGADPATQDDLEDSDQTSTERSDDRPTASTSGVIQRSPDFNPARDDEEERAVDPGASGGGGGDGGGYISSMWACWNILYD